MSNKCDILNDIIRIVLPKLINILSASIKNAIPMEDANFAKVYGELQKSGLTTVDNLIKWMQAGRFLVAPSQLHITC